MALVPTMGQDSGLSEQGTIDWTKLGQMQSSASIGILSRLASAGIDSLTVAFGQAMCSAMPLGVHGEKVLQDSMKELYAVSSFGDLVWFGIGVKHILRDLVKTSQGSAMVALCAGLGEAFTNELSALVLYELAKLSGSPRDLTPSFAQWRSLVKVAGSIFAKSTMGTSMEQLSRLSGIDAQDLYVPSDPRDLAEVILAIGRVVRGDSETVTVIGGSACSWIFSWAEFVLGLRVQVFAKHGGLIFANYDPKMYEAQLSIQFDPDQRDPGKIYHVGHTIAVRSGAEFIRDCFGRKAGHFDEQVNHLFSGGRVEWESLLESCFGVDFTSILAEPGIESQRTTGSQEQSGSQINLKMSRKLFSERLVFGSSILLRHLNMIARYSSTTDFWEWALRRFPELLNLQKDVFKLCREVDTSLREEDRSSNLTEPEQITGKFYAIHDEMKAICTCETCSRDTSSQLQRSFCISAISETILMLLFLCSGLILDAPLTPTRYGIQFLYDIALRAAKVASAGLSLFGWDDDGETTPTYSSFGPTLARLTARTGSHGSEKLHVYETPFCIGKQTFKPDLNRSAISNGKIYAYIAPLKTLTDDVASSVQIHVGVGGIQFQSELYDTVYDPVPKSGLTYTVNDIRYASDLSSLGQNTSSPGLTIRAMIEEQVDKLSFWFETSSRTGKITIPPARLAARLLESSEYLMSVSGHVRDIPISDLGDVFPSAEGEGDVVGFPNRDECLLRPLRGNMLGRCIAISCSDGPVALARDDKELKMFIQAWCDQLWDEYGNRGCSLVKYTLVS